MVKSYIMKKIVLFFALCQISFIVFSQNFKVGTYFNINNQTANYLKKSEFLKPEKTMFVSWEYGLLFDYKFNETFRLKTSVGYSQNHLLFPNFFISSFQYNDVPLSVVSKINVLKINNFSVFVENGVSLAFCHSYNYNRVIETSASTIKGSISDYSFTSNWSFGFVNGIGISYLIKSKFEIDIFANYYSGINKVWENNSILINEVGGGQNFYTISSNGSCINIGLGLGYCF